MKITLKHNQKAFFTSDTHYHHANICHGTSAWDGDRMCRPFQTLEEMDSAIVRNINNVVGVDDILIHLGDWSFGGKDQIWNFRKQIKCKNIHLILGNHDHHISGNKVLDNVHAGLDEHLIDAPNPKKYGDARDMMFDVNTQQLFKSVSSIVNLSISVPQKQSSKLVAQPKNIKYQFVLCHFPLASWDNMSQGTMHLHGHIHTPNEYKLGPGRMMDVGIDGNEEFKPYELNEVVSLLKDRPIKGLLQHDLDHHE